MQINEIIVNPRTDIREYLRDTLISRDFENLHLILNTSKLRLTKMLNYITTHPWQFDHLVILIRRIGVNTSASAFISKYGLIHDLSEFQIQALDQFLALKN